jgi:nucleotide-binding universal stress UspA family protein
MIRFKRILCPTDFSKFSFRAADYAVALAKHYDGEVHFVHVVPEMLLHPDQYPYLVEPVRAEPEIRQRALDRLDAFVALTRAEQIESRFSVKEGQPVSTILGIAEDDGVDLICLGTHGREGVERLVLGSVAEKVLRKSNCPVLTVSEPGEEGVVRPAVFETILCAVDFARLSMRSLDYALSLAQEAGGKLLLVNVVEWFSEEPGWETRFNVDEYRKEMEDSVRDRLEEVVPKQARDWCEVETIVKSGKAYREILEIADERSANLVVMGVRGRNPLDLMLFGSTTQHVVRHASCPVMTIAGSED